MHMWQFWTELTLITLLATFKSLQETKSFKMCYKFKIELIKSQSGV